MECRQIELEMPEGYKKDVTVCKDVDLPSHIKGATNKEDIILISKYLSDLDVPDPELYVWIHEFNHMLYPEKTEYEIRRISDKEYKMRTGIEIDTTSYFSYANHLEKEFD